jgi:hypothetical protein
LGELSGDGEQAHARRASKALKDFALGRGTVNDECEVSEEAHPKRESPSDIKIDRGKGSGPGIGF